MARQEQPVLPVNKIRNLKKNRGQVILGIEQSLGSTTTMAVNAYRSQELDYISNAIVVTFSQEFISEKYYCKQCAARSMMTRWVSLLEKRRCYK